MEYLTGKELISELTMLVNQKGLENEFTNIRRDSVEALILRTRTQCYKPEWIGEHFRNAAEQGLSGVLIGYEGKYAVLQEFDNVDMLRVPLEELSDPKQWRLLGSYTARLTQEH